jgi:hypothetical protein
MRKQILASITLVALPLTQAGGCGGGGKPSLSETYAGDGITQFGTKGGTSYADKGASGKLKWGKTYHAHKQNASDVQNCKWSLYYIGSDHKVVDINKGGYGTAKVNVGKQVTRKVYLKSLNCGLWQ